MKTKLYFLLSTFYFLLPKSSYAQFGTIENPTGYDSTQGEGFFAFLSNVLKFAGVIAGIYFVIQIIMAGFAYINANGDIKKTEAASATIWQSIIGMVIVASAFIIASLVSKFTGINILNPTIVGPND